MNKAVTEKDFIKLFGEEDYQKYRMANFPKFSKWNYSLDQLMFGLPMLSESIFKKSDYKYYIIDHWFVFRWEKNGAVNYGIGMDFEGSEFFDFMKG